MTAVEPSTEVCEPEREAGVVLVWFALLLFALVGITALCVDIGLWYVEAVHVQSAKWLADPALFGPLVRLRGSVGAELDAGGTDDALEEAIARCDPALQAAEVAAGRALLDAAERMMPGENVRLSCDVFDSEAVHVEVGSEIGGTYVLAHILDAAGGDVDLAVAAMAVDLVDDEDGAV